MYNNKDMYAFGYGHGYNYVKFEGGTAYGARSELLSRGISLRTSWAVGFRKGAQDAENGFEKKYHE